jgi:hypothetical protein
MIDHWEPTIPMALKAISKMVSNRRNGISIALFRVLMGGVRLDVNQP